MTSFVCVVCFEEHTERLPLPKLSTLNGDVFRAADCNHPVCQVCLASFVTARVEDQRAFGVRCPFESCKNELHQQDIDNLSQRGALASEVAKKFAELRKQDYTARFSALTDDTHAHTVDDYRLMRQLWATTRRCPRCNVIMERSEGCNSFGCICGHKFDFLKAPRGCGDGIEDFDSVIHLAAEFEMPFKDAQQRVAAACAMGIARYQRVLSKATQKHIPLNVAEVHARADLRQDSALQELKNARCKRRLDKKTALLMSQLSISFEDAALLLEQAKSGDGSTWARIREARRLQSHAYGDPSVPLSNATVSQANQTDTMSFTGVNMTSPESKLPVISQECARSCAEHTPEKNAEE